MNIKSLLLSVVTALSFASATPALAGKFVVDGEHYVGGVSLGGSWSDGVGITKQTFESESGHVSESDLSIEMDKNGLKKLQYTGRDAGYSVSENYLKGGQGGYVATGAFVGGTIQMTTKIKKD